jgi:hypothetical protein
MEAHSIVWPVERRCLADRRARPTSLRSTLRLWGRRKGFRRVGEGGRAYVDCPSPRVVVLVALIFVGSLLDAYLTLLHLQQGGREMNPLMALALARGPTVFVGIKMGLTSAGMWVLAAHQQFPLAYKALYGVALGYLGLLGVHAALLLT